MAERFKAAVLKTVERKFRGFESYSLRHSLAREATGKGFLGRENSWAQERDITVLRKRLFAKYGEVAELAEGARLLSVCRFTPTEGSNPSLSATTTVGVNWQEFVKPRITVVSSQGHFNLSAEILR